MWQARCAVRRLVQRTRGHGQQQPAFGVGQRRGFQRSAMAFEEGVDAKLLALTAAQVSAATKKYLDPSKLTAVKAGDFKSVPAPK